MARDAPPEPTSPDNTPPAAAECPCANKKTPPRSSPRWSARAELLMGDSHAIALTGWLEAAQAELTVLHRTEDGTITATAYRFCASREALAPTSAFAQVPAA